MAQGRIKQRLAKENSKDSVNATQFLSVNLQSETKLLPPNEINKVLDVGEEFDKEREKSKCYRILGTISPVFSNPLFNITGRKPNLDTDLSSSNFGWESFDGSLFVNDPYDNDFTGRADINYETSVGTHLKEIDGWFGFYDPDPTRQLVNGVSSSCVYYDMEPTRKRFELGVDNWGFTVTYPKTNDDQHHLVKGGLLITNSERIEIGGRPMLALGTAVKNNLSVGDSVTLTEMSVGVLNGTFEVVSLGLSNGDNQDVFFVINVNPDEQLIPVGASFETGRMKRLYYGKEVTYYLRKFEKVKGLNTQAPIDKDDYEIYPLAFSKNIYNDKVYQIAFNEEIDIEGLTDNLGRPLSELYLTMTKKDSSVFTNIISGFDMEPFIGNTKTIDDSLKLSNVRKMFTNSPEEPFTSHDPLETNVRITDTSFYGDIVEYSKYEVQETILQPVMHRFNTINRENISPNATSISNGGENLNAIGGPRNEGYLYQPHQIMKIRQFSNYVEQGDESTIDIPSYAENLGDGRFIWRDLLTIGYNDGQEETIDYPFLNGCHYLHNNFCIVTKRQDPFGNFGLYYGGASNFPPDPAGDTLTDKFIVKNSGDVC
jgi:hypothetical protein